VGKISGPGFVGEQHRDIIIRKAGALEFTDYSFGSAFIIN